MSLSKHRRNPISGFARYRVKLDVSVKVINEYYKSLDCPRSLACWLLYESGEHQQLADMSFRPLDYNSLEDTRDAYYATKFLSKYEDLSLSLDPDEVAYAKFSKTEEACRQTNIRFRSIRDDPYSVTGHLGVLHRATRRIIGKILGEFNPRRFFDVPDWGPGASTLMKRSDASPEEKFQSEIGITRDLYDLITEPMLEIFSPIWFKQLKKAGYPSFQVGNKVITVKKDATSSRVIAKEPGINLFFQKAMGIMIEEALLPWGVDIHSQSKNAHMSRKASLTGSHVTVDFSSASDMNARYMVESVLPARWFHVMDALRSHYGWLEGVPVPIFWEKFSSMGNGFTFPLETLIFFASAKAVAEYLGCKESIAVYGDDVIIPSSCFELYSELVKFYGFSINPKKTHSEGWFRESCGAHYYSGRDITPVYFRGRLAHITDVYQLYNAIRRLAWKEGGNSFCLSKFRMCCDHLIRSVPVALRLRIPEGIGDGGFISNFDEASAVRARHYIEGYKVKHLSQVSMSSLDEREGYLIAWLWRLLRRTPSIERLYGRSNLTIDEAMRKLEVLSTLMWRKNLVSSHRTRYKFSHSIVRQWPDLGPWETAD